MPWFPDFVSAVELARRQTRAAGQADPVEQYLTALDEGDTRALESVWPGRVVVYDPRAGEVRGHRQLQEFMRRNRSWLAQHHARIDTVAATSADGRAVVELLAHLTIGDRLASWPVAVVAESHDEMSVVFRSYCSQWPLDGRRHFRASVLPPGPPPTDDVVERFHTALAAGDADAVARTFAPDGYVREAIGPPYTHRGPAELRAYFTTCFSAGGGIELQPCAVTDDGARCVVEYNCVRWGRHELPAQAGLAVYERGPDGLLAAVRIYDDVEAPHP